MCGDPSCASHQFGWHPKFHCDTPIFWQLHYLIHDHISKRVKVIDAYKTWCFSSSARTKCCPICSRALFLIKEPFKVPNVVHCLVRCCPRWPKIFMLTKPCVSLHLHGQDAVHFFLVPFSWQNGRFRFEMLSIASYFVAIVVDVVVVLVVAIAIAVSKSTHMFPSPLITQLLSSACMASASSCCEWYQWM